MACTTWATRVECRSTLATSSYNTVGPDNVIGNNIVDGAIVSDTSHHSIVTGNLIGTPIQRVRSPCPTATQAAVPLEWSPQSHRR